MRAFLALLVLVREFALEHRCNLQHAVPFAHKDNGVELGSGAFSKGRVLFPFQA